MAEFVPQLTDVVEFPMGEHPHINEQEKPLIWLATFFRPDVSVLADSIGLYFKRTVGDVSKLDMRANIYVYDPLDTIKPIEPIPGYHKVTTLALDIDLTSVLSPPTGWKAIPITPFNFEANHTYIIYFEMVSEPYIQNGVVDNIVISAAEQFDIPLVPSDYPYPSSRYQTKNTFGFGRIPRTGNVYTYPVAVAIYGEAGAPPIDCTQRTTETECILNGCHWWSDGTCHSTPETPLPPIQYGGIILLLVALGLGAGLLMGK